MSETMTDPDGTYLVNSGSSGYYDYAAHVSGWKVKVWLTAKYTPRSWSDWLDAYGWIIGMNKRIDHEIRNLWAADFDDRMVEAWASRGVKVRPIDDGEAGRMASTMGRFFVPYFVPGPGMDDKEDEVDEELRGMRWDHLDHLHRLDPEYQEFLAVLGITDLFAKGALR